MSDLLGDGIRIITSEWVPGPRTEVYDDWRERLARNLARPSTGKWEPLDRRIPGAMYFVPSWPLKQRQLVMHPEQFAVLLHDIA